jgi:Flp pilus assembly protein TadB
MAFIERLSLKERFSSPAALALFGAFAVPEPFGTIILAYAAFWWWRSRKIKSRRLGNSDAPSLAAIKPRAYAAAYRLFQLGRDRTKRGVELGADAVDCGYNHNGNAGSDNGIFDGGSPGLVLHKSP